MSVTVPSDPPPWSGQIEDGARILLFLGRLDRKKNVHGLIEAVAALKGNRQLGGWKLVIAGPGSPAYLNALKRQLREAGLGAEVVLIGPVYEEAKTAAFAHADAFALPSFSEGQPLAVLEAWSYRLPVVMTRACNLPEGFQVGAAREIATDAHAMSCVLADFLAQPDTVRTAMGAAGHTLVARSFTWPRIAAAFRDLYAWLLGRAARPACVQRC